MLSHTLVLIRGSLEGGLNKGAVLQLYLRMATSLAEIAGMGKTGTESRTAYTWEPADIAEIRDIFTRLGGLLDSEEQGQEAAVTYCIFACLIIVVYSLYHSEFDRLLGVLAEKMPRREQSRAHVLFKDPLEDLTLIISDPYALAPLLVIHIYFLAADIEQWEMTQTQTQTRTRASRGGTSKVEGCILEVLDVIGRVTRAIGRVQRPMEAIPLILQLLRYSMNMDLISFVKILRLYVEEGTIEAGMNTYQLCIPLVMTAFLDRFPTYRLHSATVLGYTYYLDQSFLITIMNTVAPPLLWALEAPLPTEQRLLALSLVIGNAILAQSPQMLKFLRMAISLLRLLAPTLPHTIYIPRSALFEEALLFGARTDVYELVLVSDGTFRRWLKPLKNAEAFRRSSV
ncbi:hypothetical protein GMRT_13981 [Giardia muris]|uniref:Uncharacterized protein n=1 Tax=Giardia muris TaxID=5742 RepID=A0A4Z1T6A5_GIAMU|nr:hypothetical protein GMRT_13981 [Giardia muris]|eukprot:TNJ29593.1 hypothetical protein GMRT_13981 [Giardia muris]